MGAKILIGATVVLGKHLDFEKCLVGPALESSFYGPNVKV